MAAQSEIKTFIVLGMHRSATSLTAGGLSKHNVFMGDDLLGRSESNEYGHFEDRDFITLNDKILREAGGSWESPPPEDKIMQAAKSSDIGGFIRKKEKAPFWGWKDPRTTLTIRAYMPHLKNPHFIVNFRDPEQVAQSLKKRNGFSIGMCRKLVATYNFRLLGFLIDYADSSYKFA